MSSLGQSGKESNLRVVGEELTVGAEPEPERDQPEMENSSTYLDEMSKC
jgi:hypothetical protein